MKKTKRINADSIVAKIEGKRKEIKKAGVKKIGIFGSFVKGEQNNKSDIDILVEFEKVTFDNYFFLKELLEKLLKRKIDLIIESDLRPELNYVKKETKYVKI